MASCAFRTCDMTTCTHATTHSQVVVANAPYNASSTRVLASGRILESEELKSIVEEQVKYLSIKAI